MKIFTLKVTQAGLEKIVQHLGRGSYAEVAELLSDLHGQVSAQLPKSKMPVQTANPQPQSNGAARYARSASS